MTSKAAVEEFVGQAALAVVGVSRGGKKFGNVAYRALKAKGCRVYPIHPQAETVEGDRCFARFADLPEAVGGVLVVVPPAQAEKVVREASEAGIRRVWLQQGAQSEAAVGYCREKGISCVAGECIMMFVRGKAFPHNVHRWIWGVLGKLPR